MRWNALDQAETYRQQALERRNEGGNTVRVFKSAAALDSSRRTIEGGERIVAELRAAWQFARSEAIEAFRGACYGDEYAALCDGFCDGLL